MTRKNKDLLRVARERDLVNRRVKATIRDLPPPPCQTCANQRIVNTPQPSGYPHAFPCPDCRPDSPCSCGLGVGKCPGPARVVEWKLEQAKATISAAIGDRHYLRGMRDGLDRSWRILQEERTKDESGASARATSRIFNVLETLAPINLKNDVKEPPR